jgi:GTP1/OBG
MAAQDAWPSPGRTTAQVSRHYTQQTFFVEVPSGGDGGDGGDVYFRATGRLGSLYDLRRAHFYGNNGKYGMVIAYFTIIKKLGEGAEWNHGPRQVLLGPSWHRSL